MCHYGTVVSSKTQSSLTYEVSQDLSSTAFGFCDPIVTVALMLIFRFGLSSLILVTVTVVGEEHCSGQQVFLVGHVQK